MKNPIVTIEMQNGKKIVAELYPEKAPNTVNNFISLVKSGFYDGLTFHRVIDGFMIQGGDPAGTGAGGPGYTIKGEFALNGFKQNDIKHSRGVLSMARTMMPNSAVLYNAQNRLASRRAVRRVRKGDREYGCSGRDSNGQDRLPRQTRGTADNEEGHLRYLRRSISGTKEILR